jgi:hypothetical protein
MTVIVEKPALLSLALLLALLALLALPAHAQNSCRSDPSYLGLGTAYRLDSMTTREDYGHRVRYIYHYDANGLPTAYEYRPNYDYLVNDAAIEVKNHVAKWTYSFTNETYFYLGPDSKVDSSSDRAYSSAKNFKTFEMKYGPSTTVKLYFDTLGRESRRDSTFYSKSERLDFIKNGPQVELYDSCFSAQDTCYCKSLKPSRIAQWTIVENGLVKSVHYTNGLYDADYFWRKIGTVEVRGRKPKARSAEGVKRFSVDGRSVNRPASNSGDGWTWLFIN